MIYISEFTTTQLFPLTDNESTNIFIRNVIQCNGYTHYLYLKYTNTRYQLWTAVSDLDGNNFTEKQITFLPDDTYYDINEFFDYNIKEYNNKVYVVYISQSYTLIDDYPYYTNWIENLNLVSINYDGSGYSNNLVVSNTDDTDNSLYTHYLNFEINNDIIYFTSYADIIDGNNTIGDKFYLNKFTINGLNYSSNQVYINYRSDNNVMISSNILNSFIDVLIIDEYIYYIYMIYNHTEHEHYYCLSESDIDGNDFIPILSNMTNQYTKYYCYSSKLNTIYLIRGDKIVVYNITNNQTSYLNTSDSSNYNVYPKIQIDDDYIYSMNLYEYNYDTDIYISKFNINTNIKEYIYESYDLIERGYSVNYSSYYNFDNYTYYIYYIGVVDNVEYLYIGKYSDYVEPPPLPPGYPWSMYQSDAKRTGRSNNIVKISSDANIEWNRTANIGEAFSNIVVGSDSTVYYGTSSGKLIAVNYNGTTKWICDLSWIVEESTWEWNEETQEEYEVITTRTVTPILSYGCPAIADDGTIYVASGYSSEYGGYYGFKKLFAVNPDGSLKWRHDIYAGHYDSPSALTIDNEGVVILSSYYVHAINPNGTLKWRNVQDYTKTKPVISGDLVYQFGNYGVYAINRITGVTVWHKYVANNGSLYVVYNNQPFIFSNSLGYIYNGVLYSRNLLDGEIEWTYNISAGNILAIGVDNTIYVYSNSNIYALNSNGTLKWSYNISGSINSNVKYGNIVIDANGNLFFTISVTTQLKKLICINSSGNLVFESILGNYSLAIGGDGNLYASTPYSIIKIVGNYVPPTPVLPQVQCRATQIIASANTGKLILAVPIL